VRMPVIATDWSAQCDFINAGNAYPIAVDRLVPAVVKCPYYEEFRWAEPSYSDLQRHVYRNRGEARAKRRERALREVLSRWTWDNAALKIIARLDERIRYLHRSHNRRAACYSQRLLNRLGPTVWISSDRDFVRVGEKAC
jgi:hypothetical protein